MTIDFLPPPRRVVTGHDSEGRARIIEDGPSPAMLTVGARPGYRNTNMWRTVGGPTPIAAEDTITEHSGVMPPPGGTVLRVIDFPPMVADLEERKRLATETLKALYPDAGHDQSHSKPGMHVTRSIDYAIVLSGTITAILEENETDLNAGDILIQRGTNHAWENRTDEIVRVAFVLIDGK
jgi:mannose-6-phosphate isomerase-like protein (cupin superfamily)